ncbi:hypothetical protein M422DRAFT_241085 [Sphaerobolus stellatus SS14]|nr:hypothetical protein M422DRAFT_241085 [Sphaerobolus stellatus SS14]
MAESNVCPVCKKGFTRTTNLRRHMSSHAENKPKFTCNLCNGVEFSRYDSLFRHQKVCLIKAAKKTGILSQADCQKSANSEVSTTLSPVAQDSNLLVAVVRHTDNAEGNLYGQDISSIFHPKNAYTPDFATINLPRFFNAGSPATSFFGDTMSRPSLSNLESPSFQTIPSLASLDDSSLETPFREEYLSNGIKYYMRNFPLLHISTWDKTHAHPLLEEALVMRGASYIRITPAQIQVSDDYVLKVLRSNLRDRIFRAFMDISNHDLDLQYELLLAMSLVQCAGCIHKSPTERGITDGYHTMTKTMLYNCGLFVHLAKWRASVNLPDLSAVHDLWKQWIRYESMKR